MLSSSAILKPMEIKEKRCLACARQLKGRTDKKFCDDTCRNNYNNRQNSDQNNFVRNINNILRKNRRILQQFMETGVPTVKVRRETLLQQGFQPRYHTHQHQTQKGQVYQFCYEYGYLLLEADWVLIVKRDKP